MGWASKAKHHLVSINAQKAIWVNTAVTVQSVARRWQLGHLSGWLDLPREQEEGGRYLEKVGLRWAGRVSIGMSRGERTDHYFETNRPASFLKERSILILYLFKGG